LNTNVVLAEIGYAGETGTAWEKLFKVATGNIIITALGFVPGASLVHRSRCGDSFQKGYYMTVLTTEKLGRKFIQVMGFLMEALFRELFRILLGNLC